jgi:tetratricopeptide (TPR) repeat protein
MPATPQVPGWLGHALGGLAALALIFKALWMRFGEKFRNSPEREARRAALREITAMTKTTDDNGFLMAAGRFIESRLGPVPPPEAREILAERDTRCFRGGMPAANPLDSEKRASIIRTLRGLVTALCAVFLIAASAGESRAENTASDARAAYEAARYDDAITGWLKSGSYESLSPDVLYNIGNACYRAGSPGHAALYYRRALARDPGHLESRQNLRFIERKHGSITVQRPEYQYALARIPLSSWKGMLWTGAWFCALGLLVFAATRPAARLRVAAVIALVIAPLLAAGGALGWRYYPDDAEFAPVSRQAVIIGEKVILHSEASRTSPEVIDAPPGSLCEVVRESGRWAYVSFATKTCGWVPVESIEPIISAGVPQPPKIRKPRADGSSA